MMLNGLIYNIKGLIHSAGAVTLTLCNQQAFCLALSISKNILWHSIILFTFCVMYIIRGGGADTSGTWSIAATSATSSMMHIIGGVISLAVTWKPYRRVVDSIWMDKVASHKYFNSTGLINTLLCEVKFSCAERKLVWLWIKLIVLNCCIHSMLLSRFTNGKPATRLVHLKDFS